MSNESFSLVKNALKISKRKEKDEILIEGLSKETILPFIAAISIFIQKFQYKKTFSIDFSNLIIEGMHFSENNGLTVITASIDEILTNYFELYQSKIISTDCSFQVLHILIINLISGNYLSKKTIIFNLIFQLSNQNNSSEIQSFFDEVGFDVLNICLSSK